MNNNTIISLKEKNSRQSVRIRDLKDTIEKKNLEVKKMSKAISELKKENVEMHQELQALHQKQCKQSEEKATKHQKEKKKLLQNNIMNWIYYFYEIGVYSCLIGSIYSKDYHAIAEVFFYAVIVGLIIIAIDVCMKRDSYRLRDSYFRLAKDFIQTVAPVFFAGIGLLKNAPSQLKEYILGNYQMVYALLAMVVVFIVMAAMTKVVIIVSDSLKKRNRRGRRSN